MPISGVTWYYVNNMIIWQNLISLYCRLSIDIGPPANGALISEGPDDVDLTILSKVDI